ncbi:hypothetical protein BV25DRAFT_1916071 [Artomyces pyxidatus]|uniref:Uncharacterized protein n=1 Tax=Artomyces pyxidatus TaxID=48021 RepID=A0ACB8T1D5_9AGAM|nr:hypothetical protein BV25DRAFT_1916071 [Artomyces pyxidatus]
MSPPDEYAALNQADDVDELENFDAEVALNTRESSPAVGFTLSFLVFSVFVVSVLSCGLSAIITFNGLPVPSRKYAYEWDRSDLRRPSLYMGLERVPEIKASSGTPAKEEPTVIELPTGVGRAVNIVRVNARHPQAQFPRDGWVLLTDEDATFLHFDLDNLAAECAFHLFFPTRDALTRTGKLLTLEGAPTIEIFQVSSKGELTNITWASRPPRGASLGRFQATYGGDVKSRSFDCGGSGNLTVEMVCVSVGCRVEYREEDDPGIHVQISRA